MIAFEKEGVLSMQMQTKERERKAQRNQTNMLIDKYRIENDERTVHQWNFDALCSGIKFFSTV